MLGRKLVEVGPQGLVRDVQREVVRLVASLLQDGEKSADLTEVTVGRTLS